MDKKKKLTGRVVLVQEERFRVVDDRGRSYLFDLSHDAPATNRDLLEWSRAKTWLVVEYEGEPDIDSGIAHSVRAA
jgi:hypothetical protein